jgi:hypothetical protein
MRQVRAHWKAGLIVTIALCMLVVAMIGLRNIRSTGSETVVIEGTPAATRMVLKTIGDAFEKQDNLRCLDVTSAADGRSLRVKLRSECRSLLRTADSSSIYTLWRSPWPVTIRVVPTGTVIHSELYPPLEIGPAPQAPPGISFVDHGAVTIYLLDPADDQGVLPPALVSTNEPLQVRPVDVLYHELGHLSSMLHVVKYKSTDLSRWRQWSEQEAVAFENSSRGADHVLLQRRWNGKIELLEYQRPVRIRH